jgi:hypothetical protein
MSTLANLEAQAAQIEQEILNYLSRGESAPDDLLCLQNDIAEDRKAKIDCYHIVLERLDAQVIRAKNHAEQFYIHAKSLQNEIERIENWLKYIMNATNATELKGNRFDLVLRETHSTEVHDETVIPSEYQTTKVMTSVDKLKLKEHLKQGLSIPGARLVKGYWLKWKTNASKN